MMSLMFYSRWNELFANKTNSRWVHIPRPLSVPVFLLLIIFGGNSLQIESKLINHQQHPQPGQLEVHDVSYILKLEGISFSSGRILHPVIMREMLKIGWGNKTTDAHPEKMTPQIYHKRAP